MSHITEMYKSMYKKMNAEYSKYQQQFSFANKPYESLGVNGHDVIEKVSTPNFMLTKHLIKSCFKENEIAIYDGVVPMPNEDGSARSYFIKNLVVPSDDCQFPVYSGYTLNLEDGSLETIASLEKTEFIQNVVSIFDLAKAHAMLDESCFVCPEQ